MQKIFLFAIGIGGNTNERELRGIATDEENFMFKVDGYSALDGIKNLLAIRTCRGKCKIITCTTHERDPYAVADNAGADQPAHLRRLIWAFVVRLQNQWVL